MQRKRIPRLNEYQSRRGTSAALTRRQSPPAHQGPGAHAPLWRGDIFLCISGYVDSKKFIILTLF